MSRFNISHETIINVPVEEVWKELIAIDDWEWNKWTKLKADNPPREGVRGKYGHLSRVMRSGKNSISDLDVLVNQNTY